MIATSAAIPFFLLAPPSSSETLDNISFPLEIVKLIDAIFK